MLLRLSYATLSRRFLKRIIVFVLAGFGVVDAENEQICRYQGDA
jgi:hypothetical protein